eukprot:scaffold37797_cov73-Phaeocystis_antarctica.AAC.1
MDRRRRPHGRRPRLTLLRAPCSAPPSGAASTAMRGRDARLIGGGCSNALAATRNNCTVVCNPK